VAVVEDVEEEHTADNVSERESVGSRVEGERSDGTAVLPYATHHTTMLP
jgi:hypothetical protein